MKGGGICQRRYWPEKVTKGSIDHRNTSFPTPLPAVGAQLKATANNRLFPFWGEKPLAVHWIETEYLQGERVLAGLVTVAVRAPSPLRVAHNCSKPLQTRK